VAHVGGFGEYGEYNVVSFVLNAGDLTTVTPGNQIHKYADDTYIVIPACNAHVAQSRADR